MKVKMIAILLAVLIGGTGIMLDRISQPSNLVLEANNNEIQDNYNTSPDFSFKTLKEENYNLKDLKEPIVLVHFWASWCGVCKAEFPELLKMVEDMNGKVALLSISIDDKKASMEKFIGQITQPAKDNKNNYWIWDEKKHLSLEVFNSMKTPETIVLDPDRKMVRKIVGKTSWIENAKYFEQLLGK